MLNIGENSLAPCSVSSWINYNNSYFISLFVALLSYIMLLTCIFHIIILVNTCTLYFTSLAMDFFFALHNMVYWSFYWRIKVCKYLWIPEKSTLTYINLKLQRIYLRIIHEYAYNEHEWSRILLREVRRKLAFRVNFRHWSDVELMLAHRLRSWPSDMPK